MAPPIRGALSRAAARASGSRFAKPVAHVALVAVGLFVLAAIGGGAAARAVSAAPESDADAGTAAELSSFPAPATSSPTRAREEGTPPEAPSSSAAAVAEDVAARTAGAEDPHEGRRGPASPDDPVFLNTASVDDLRRLPGIGPKKADAILALRTRMGRFRAVEDLLKVKGFGRATLRRLRPLLRVDPPPADRARDLMPDGGPAPPSRPRR